MAAVFLAYDPNAVKPGWVAFGVVLALAVATFLLWRSMNTQLRKIRMPPKQRDTPASQDGRTPEGQPPRVPNESSNGDDPVG